MVTNKNHLGKRFELHHKSYEHQSHNLTNVPADERLITVSLEENFFWIFERMLLFFALTSGY
jgi:hypothetical protein